MKKLKRKYIRLLLETLSKEEYLEELKRTKYLIGVETKPQRSEKSQRFIDFIEENCYKGNTVIDLMRKHYKVPNNMELKTDDAWVSFTKVEFDELKKQVNFFQKTASKKINAAFKLHKKELKDILN